MPRLHQLMWVAALGCAPVLSKDTPDARSEGPSPDTSVGPQSPSDPPATTDTSAPLSLLLDGEEGALVTSDCRFEDYSYAIDILLSCGSERFADELRLHTFKRHSHSHQRVFNDQRLTYRDGQLWFDAYATPRCVKVDPDGRLFLATSAADCASVVFAPHEGGHLIQDTQSGLCVVLGESECDAHRSTGGQECGGVDHRYLPLRMGDCTDALAFAFSSQAASCADEYPQAACF